MRDIQTFLSNLPGAPGVYQMLDAKGVVIYVGKAKHLKKRISSYFSGRVKDLKTASLVKHIHDIEITVTSSENEAVLLECNFIKKFRPRYNVLLRDDKSYPYIVITDHPYPRIESYRGARKKHGRYFGPYPSSLAVKETISLLQKMFRLRTCRDSYYQARSRPCLLYQIGRCSGPCVGLVSKEEYAANVKLATLFLEGKNKEVIHELQRRMEAASHAMHFELAAHYRDQIARLQQIQEKQYVNVDEGNADIIGFAEQAGVYCLQILSIRGGQILGSKSYFPSVPSGAAAAEIMTAFLTQYYMGQADGDTIPREIITAQPLDDDGLLESALSSRSRYRVHLLVPQRGEKQKWLSMATESAKQSLAVHLFSKINQHERFKSLQTALTLRALPKRIECFDISHSSGEATVASCVVFDKNGPLKTDYRRYNISGITPGDDVAAMHQALLRRFKRVLQDQAVMPSLLLIDGGKTQLGAARAVMNELGLKGILLLGVSKGPGRKPGYETLHREGQPPVHLPADSLALHLIQQIRDEAHRFAITGHRMRRDKSRRQSTLELIPGIGAQRRRELLRYFGGIQGVARANLDELMKVPGINRPLAERIFAAFHDATL